MGSLIERSSSSRSSTPLIRGGVVIAYDATKNQNIQEVKDIVCHVMKREDLIQESSTITVLGVLDKVLHPMGFQIQIGPESFVGAHGRAVREEVLRKANAYVSTLQNCAEEYEGKGVDIKVKIAVGVPMKNVLVQEIVALKATWAVIDRQLKKELRFYVNHIPCKVALICDNLSVAVLRAYCIDKSIDTMKHKLLYSLSKPVSPPFQDNESDKQSVSSFRSCELPNGSMKPLCESKSKERSIFLQDESRSNPQQEIPGSQNEQRNNCQNEQRNNYDESPQVMQEERSPENHSEVPVLCTSSAPKKEQEAVGTSDSKMQNKPVEFSSDTLQEEGVIAEIENGHDGSGQVTKPQQKYDVYFPSDTIGGMDPVEYSFSNIQTATDDFSCDNFLGEGGYGVVYKGKLENGQLIAVKVQDEASTQSVAAFTAEVYALSFARHTNIVTLLGYCCNENLKILIYEYISNKSLEWHLFDNTGDVLEWNRRHAIAIGTAKGLRFLHEECRGSPIIHRDLRPSNILLTHDFVPLLGDWGLAKWKTNKFDKQRKTLGNLEYIAPEYAENGICSVKTDVYAFGLLLLQLISGRNAVDSMRDDLQKSIRHWALPLIQTLALDDLVDPRLGDAYCLYEVYSMARAAHLCIQTKYKLRPTMGEVLCILEGTNDHLRHVKSHLYPMIINAEDTLN